jgi:hypothetical protein
VRHIRTWTAKPLGNEEHGSRECPTCETLNEHAQRNDLKKVRKDTVHAEHMT